MQIAIMSRRAIESLLKVLDWRILCVYLTDAGLDEELTVFESKC